MSDVESVHGGVTTLPPLCRSVAQRAGDALPYLRSFMAAATRSAPRRDARLYGGAERETLPLAANRVIVPHKSVLFGAKESPITPRRVDARPWSTHAECHSLLKAALQPWWNWRSQNQLQFPDRRLVQWDCGKLQILDRLLRRLKAGKHRCLIFTQMSKMLNVLEVFLNLHGHTYLRLDGSTHVEARQQKMDRFNTDVKVFCFILSTRSGGLGINLTGADTVIFYDSDWNPAMDAQAQDRAHRIGQTREVHIYRLVSRATIEENILLKANQKRDLNRLSIEEGNLNATGLVADREVAVMAESAAAAAAAASAAVTAAAAAAPGEAQSASAVDAQEVARLGGDAAGFSIFKKGSLKALLGDAAVAVEAAKRERGAADDDAGDGGAFGGAKVVEVADSAAAAVEKAAAGGAGEGAGEGGTLDAPDDDAEEAQVRAAMAQLEDQTDASAALRAAREVAEEGRLVNEDESGAAGKGAGSRSGSAAASRAATPTHEDKESLTKAEADQWRATGDRLRMMLRNLPGIQQFALRFRERVQVHQLMSAEAFAAAEAAIAHEEEIWEREQAAAADMMEEERRLMQQDPPVKVTLGVMADVTCGAYIYHSRRHAARQKRVARLLSGDQVRATLCLFWFCSLSCWS